MIESERWLGVHNQITDKVEDPGRASSTQESTLPGSHSVPVL